MKKNRWILLSKSFLTRTIFFCSFVKIQAHFYYKNGNGIAWICKISRYFVTNYSSLLLGFLKNWVRKKSLTHILKDVRVFSLPIKMKTNKKMNFQFCWRTKENSITIYRKFIVTKSVNERSLTRDEHKMVYECNIAMPNGATALLVVVVVFILCKKSHDTKCH